jgi:NAD(P)-dependent dehydrogenase (short-subunit alcohol dehydrogenase family)
MTLALNFLSPFLLTLVLLRALEAGHAARIINVASSAHANGVIDFDDLQFRDSYGIGRAYAQSKLALLLFTYELARRLRTSSVTVNAVHPGLVATRFGRDNGRLRYWVRRLVKRHEISPEEGARTSVYLATSPEVDGVTGSYFVDSRPVRSSEASYDVELAARVWREGLHLTGLESLE